MKTRIDFVRMARADILASMIGQDWITEKNRTLVERVLAGETYERAGHDFGMSREGVRLACFRTFRKLGFSF